MRLSRRRIMSRFCRSARTAEATPGYWTLTATSRPSLSVPRYTWPIDAAAIGSSSKASKSSSIGSSRSSSITRRICLKETVGAASRSLASSCWNSSRYCSGTRPTSRKDITWPSFIAAPFIVPSAATICLAVSSWRRAMASSDACSERATLAARVPNCFIASLAARLATVAVRRTREVGIFSLSRAMRSAAALHARARHDVVRAIGPAHPRLGATVVVLREQHQRRRLPQRGAGLRALGIDPPPHADETVGLPLLADRARGGVAGVDDRLAGQLHERAHDRVPQVGVAGVTRRAHAADRVSKQGVSGEDDGRPAAVAPGPGGLAPPSSARALPRGARRACGAAGTNKEGEHPGRVPGRVQRANLERAEAQRLSGVDRAARTLVSS